MRSFNKLSPQCLRHCPRKIAFSVQKLEPNPIKTCALPDKTVDILLNYERVREAFLSKKAL